MKKIANIYQELVRIQEEGRDAVLCVLTDIEGSSPQIMGAKMIVLRGGEVIGTVGGGALELKLTEIAQEVMEAGSPRRVRFHLGRDLGMACGGETEAYLEPIQSREGLVIFGCGHIGLPMAEIGRLLAFRVTVVDNRPEWASRERFPLADEVVASDYDAFLKKRVFTRKDHILIVTHGHEHDQQILESVVRGEFGWLGVIGSQTKVEGAFARLRKLGISEEVIQRIETPVGLDIGAVSPEEIAISIAARLVHLRRRGAEAAGPVGLMKDRAAR